MCGICGIFTPDNAAGRPEFIQAVRRMTVLITRRGPDAEGYWADLQGHVQLGFRRLAILDLSPTGHQPMLTQDGRYALVYNGEAYNFRELRHELEHKGIHFRSTGDAEVVLYALAEWGVDALDRFNGMFALAFYDTFEKRLLLARDHAGIKPLYYMHTPQGLVFASQYDQILAHPWSRALEVNPESLAIYLRFGYIPAPRALLHDTHMLEAGCWLEIGVDGYMRQDRYFSFPVYQEPDLFGEEAYEAVDAAVTNAVRRQLVADVPVGTFLSGGIDSPLVAAKMQAVSNQTVKAFTIGTNGDRFDESSDAAIYAREIGIQHILEHFSPEQAYTMLDDVVAACGEPFADYSIFPTMLVSQLARQQVAVMLSGDGGDELFWGYAGRFGSVLSKARDFRYSHFLRSARWGLTKYLGIGNGYPNLRIPDIGAWYRAKHTRIFDDILSEIFPGMPDLPPDFTLFNYSGWESDQTAQWLRWNEYVGHLTMVLQKVDRASMYHSLEVRVPLLDREVIDVACRIDWRSCLDLATMRGKLPLRKALSRHVKHQTQTKRGFTVPMDAWLSGPLRSIFEEAVLSKKALLGLSLDRKAASEMFYKHLTGRADYAWGLWVLLSLALWEKRYFHSKNRPLFLSPCS